MGDLLRTFGPGIAVTLVAGLLGWVGWAFKRRYATSREVDRFLEPTLKAAEEVIARIHWLAIRDFPGVRAVNSFQSSASSKLDPYRDLEFALAYLFCQFELIKSKAPSFTIMRHRRIRRIRDFFKCLESSRIRFVNRNVQRAAGELLMSSSGARTHPIPLLRYRTTLESNNDFARHLRGLPEAMETLHQSTARQRLLVYGAVLHSMIETLDPKRIVIRDIPTWPNKMSARSRNLLRHKVFQLHLKYVREPQKYYSSVPKSSNFAGRS